MKGLQLYISSALFALVIVLMMSACSNSSSDSSSLSSYLRSLKGDVSDDPGSGIGGGPGAGCGNGRIDANEQCDGGVCCDQKCQFKVSEMICDFVLGTKCTGHASSCPTTSSNIKYFAANDGASSCATSGQVITSNAPGISDISPTPLPTSASTNAQYLGHSLVFTNLVPMGSFFPINVSFKNTGTLPWSFEEGVMLLMEVPNSAGGGFIYFPLNPGEVVPSGAIRNFQISIHVPNVVGTHYYRWQMVNHIGLGSPLRFGQISNFDFSLQSFDPDAYGGSGGGGGCPIDDATCKPPMRISE